LAVDYCAVSAARHKPDASSLSAYQQASVRRLLNQPDVRKFN
jgi:hypothetical protein